MWLFGDRCVIFKVLASLPAYDISSIKKVHFAILDPKMLCTTYSSSYTQNKLIYQILVNSNVPFVSYARFTVSNCSKGHFMNVDILLTYNSTIICPS